jgi:hypothetical protein
MKDKTNPILSFRKELTKKVKLKIKKGNYKFPSTMITETRESIDSSENS